MNYRTDKYGNKVSFVTLASKLGLAEDDGVRTLRSWRNGKTVPRKSKYNDIARVFDISVDIINKLDEGFYTSKKGKLKTFELKNDINYSKNDDSLLELKRSEIQKITFTLTECAMKLARAKGYDIKKSYKDSFSIKLVEALNFVLVMDYHEYYSISNVDDFETNMNETALLFAKLDEIEIKRVDKYKIQLYRDINQKDIENAKKHLEADYMDLKKIREDDEVLKDINTRVYKKKAEQVKRDEEFEQQLYYLINGESKDNNAENQRDSIYTQWLNEEFLFKEKE